MGEILFFHRSFEKSKREVRLPVSDLLKKNAASILDVVFADTWQVARA